jgi:hypothetical protein
MELEGDVVLSFDLGHHATCVGVKEFVQFSRLFAGKANHNLSLDGAQGNPFYCDHRKFSSKEARHFIGTPRATASPFNCAMDSKTG